MTKDAAPFAEVWESLRPMVASRALLAHNAARTRSPSKFRTSSRPTSEPGKRRRPPHCSALAATSEIILEAEFLYLLRNRTVPTRHRVSTSWR